MKSKTPAKIFTAKLTRPPHSLWSSKVVLWGKNKWEIDCMYYYNQLKSLTIRDCNVLQRSERKLDSLGGNKFFIILDLERGYHQTKVDKH